MLMKIEDKKVAIIHYTLTNDAGDVLDSSEGQEPMAYLHGAENIIPGLEKELLGKGAGDKVNAVIAPEDGYGIRKEELVQVVPKSNFQEQEAVTVGNQFQVQTPEAVLLATITAIEGDNVTVDMNHPLADTTLHFDVEVTEVRDATDDELTHGHIHSSGCSH